MRRAQVIIVGVAFAVGVVMAAPSADRTQPRSLTPDAMRIDLEYLKNIWVPMDRSFNSARRAEFDAYISDLENRTHSLSPADFELDVSWAVAISRNGHTESSTGRYLHSLPIRMWWFSDGLYVVRARPDLARLVGAKVERIGKFSPDQLLGKIARPNMVLMYKRISLRPTIRQSMSFADYAAGQDRLLQAAIRLGAERQSQVHSGRSRASSAILQARILATARRRLNQRGDGFLRSLPVTR